MLAVYGMLLLLPLLGLIFAALFAFVFDQRTITKQSPRMNAVYRIAFGLMWIFASIFVMIAIFFVALINWIYQLITNKRDIGVTNDLVSWWLSWSKTIYYGYA